MRRELAMALRARVTWMVAALAAFLVGHGFALAMDLFSGASRSALAGRLQSREMDPLGGIVRPTFGAVDLALVLLGPIVATRIVSVEKERGSFGVLCLQVGSIHTVLARKALSATCAASLVLLPAIACFIGYAIAGGRLDVIETAVAFLGEVLHLAVVVGASIAAASWTATLAQATTVAIAFSLTSWMIDAGTDFAALAWLGPLDAWSIDRQVTAFQRGVVAVGPLAWLLGLASGAFVIALVGARMDWAPGRRAAAALSIGAMVALLLAGCNRVHRAYDWTEGRRASLPPAVVQALRAVPGPIAIEVDLDRDDSRRRQLESDVAARLLLARPDAATAFPLDSKSTTENVRDDAYGRIVVRAGGAVRETRSTSRREIVTLVLEAAGVPDPDWTMPPYPGFPTVVEGTPRRLLLLAAYGLFPLAFLATGLALSRGRTGR